MEDKDYQSMFLKPMEREPYWRQILYSCKNNMEVLTETGVRVKHTSSGGVSIEYTRTNGDRIYSVVFKERQYVEELYRITEIAYREHPEITRPNIKVKKSLISEKVQRFIEKEEGLTNV